MTLEKQITSGADKLIGHAARSSKNDPELATAQLLLAAAVLAMTAGISKDQFCEGFVLALGETYNREGTQ
jgi:hypothetical protein